MNRLLFFEEMTAYLAANHPEIYMKAVEHVGDQFDFLNQYSDETFFEAQQFLEEFGIKIGRNGLYMERDN